MRTLSISRIAAACLLALASTNLRAADEQQLIAVLQSGAGATEKCDACQQLKTIGTVRSVTALSALLGEERTAHAARNVLETIPGPEAGTALRNALSKTSGDIKAGLIDSLGRRHEVESLPILKPLLADADATIASAAATALGKIGGKDALAALTAARAKSASAVQPALLEALLQCAERLHAEGDKAGAATIYRSVLDAGSPLQIRAAAWRGLVLSDASKRVDMITTALAGKDRLTHLAAMKLLRELGDAKVINASLKLWAGLPADSQVALLDSSLKLGAKALPTVRAAVGSAHLQVRVAAWQALAELEDSSMLPALAKAAAQGEPAERDAARDTLTRLRGPGVDKAILTQITRGEPPVKAELLRALGDRGDKGATDLLLQYADNANEPVRLAALESLRKLAVANTLPPLLNLAGKSKSERERAPVIKTLSAICQASSNKDQSTRSVLEAMDRLPANERLHLLQLLGDLATPAALTAAQAASKSPDPALAREGVRVLSQWPNAAAAPMLLELARSSTDNTLQMLALSGCISVAEQETDLSKRFDLLQQAMAAAKRPDEKKQVLGQIGQIPTPAALQVALDQLADSNLTTEAGLAAVSIAEKLAGANPQLAEDVAVKVLAQCKAQEIVKRAWALRRKPNGSGPFIQDWLVSGPYHQQGATGADSVFNTVFAPEKPGEAVNWKAMPRGDHANLGLVFPDQMNCAAYLKAKIIAPQDCKAALLMGSDDGVKAWLNGVLVHGNNVDRGMVPDQDMAPIELKKGDNQLLLKITQGGGGWMACARIVGTDGQAIAGLSVESQAGTPVAAAAPAPAPLPAPVPVPSELPKRDSFQKLKLSDQFYAEGASFGDFNKDGKMDVVAGPFWFEGPDFTTKHEIRTPTAFDPKNYSDSFLMYTGDFNRDGWLDIFEVPFPGKEGYWYENPGTKGGHWPRHLAYPMVGNESPTLVDVTGDGQPDLVFNNEGYIGYATYDTSKPDDQWKFHAISPQDKKYQRFTHGIGAGDINGDGRMDILESAGWWEQPVGATTSSTPWKFHAQKFAEAASQMLVTDVDGDGLADVINSWHCHLYGLVWYRQVRTGGEITWQQNVLMPPSPDVTTTHLRCSQMHAMVLADMNGDGLMDFVTGKRFWAHGPTGDAEADAPAVLIWFELQRPGNGQVVFVPHLIDDDSGVGTQVTVGDLNGDKRSDVIVGNKKGVFVHLRK
ncbi:MAG: hypothetical protein HOP33_14300 [Verrucomicrobia bacterium]|nr:hypothetical protein [Verrucomicrobiota bacterium]